MRYRFYKKTENSVLIPPIRDFDITLPKVDCFPRDWEWFYDFHEMRRDFFILLKSLIIRFSIFIMRMNGVILEKPQPEYARNVEFIEVDTDKVSKAIVDKLSEYSMRRFYREDLMIIVGAKEFHDLGKLEENFSFLMEIRYAEKIFANHKNETCYYILGVPVFVIPDFDGIAIVPDFSKQAIRRIDRR